MVTVTEAVISIKHTPESEFTASVSKSLFLNDLHQNKTQKCLSVVKLLLQTDKDDEDLMMMTSTRHSPLFQTACTATSSTVYECAHTK